MTKKRRGEEKKRRREEDLGEIKRQEGEKERSQSTEKKDEELTASVLNQRVCPPLPSISSRCSQFR